MGKPAERRRRSWSELIRWVGVRWLCPCQYHNVSVNRCYFCGARPPREVRDRVDAVPLPDDQA